MVEVVAVEAGAAPPYRLTTVRGTGGPVVYSGHSLFACLLEFRKDLERDELLLCCQGARPDVINSGMQSQMTGGRFVYTADLEARRVNDEMVDILAPARPGDVVTVAEQRAATFAFFGIRDRSLG
ncbi:MULTISPECIES: hypothetical protein [Streptomyces]|uniref:hypothetical protein n=1 Tax=Streptomyces TaxID=1883 RepID=UPI00345B7A3A